MNQTLVERCGHRDENDLIGSRAENIPIHRNFEITVPGCAIIFGRGVFQAFGRGVVTATCPRRFPTRRMAKAIRINTRRNCPDRSRMSKGRR
jgi:hypothetical protein